MKNERMDTTVLGLIFIALASFSYSLESLVWYFVGENAYGLMDNDVYYLLMICAVVILLAAIGAYINNLHFEAVLFTLVSAAFFLNGWVTGYLYTNISLTVMLIVLIVWAFAEKKPMMSILFILTVALSFLFMGVLSSEWLINDQATVWDLLSGVAGMLAFAMAVYLVGKSVKGGSDVFKSGNGEE